MSYTPEQLRAAAAFKLMGDICASVDVREALLEYADALDELAKWKIGGYTEGGVLKCAADLKRERDDALDALQVAREALKHERGALAFVRDRQRDGDICHVHINDLTKGIKLLDTALAAIGENNG